MMCVFLNMLMYGDDSLAYFEMRLLMTMLIFEFDLELLEKSKGWLGQKAFLLWEKTPLMVRLTPREV